MSQLSFSPKEVIENVEQVTIERIHKKFSKHMVLGIMAGMFISFGAIAFVNIFSNVADPGLGLFLASSVFPIGIFAILLMGFELVTGNTLGIVGVFEKTYTLGQYLKMLGIVWVANLAGALLAVLLAKGANVFTPAMVSTITAIGENKVNMTFMEMTLRAILCNMLVCGGVLMALSAKDNISKMAAIWLPIVVFILCRAEHIVANMFFIPMAYAFGADISILDIIYSFFFVSVGNFVGGALIIGSVGYHAHIKQH